MLPIIAFKAVTIGAQICQSFSEMDFSHSAALQRILAKYLRMNKNFNILAKYLPMNINVKEMWNIDKAGVVGGKHECRRCCLQHWFEKFDSGFILLVFVLKGWHRNIDADGFYVSVYIDISILILMSILIYEKNIKVSILTLMLMAWMGEWMPMVSWKMSSRSQPINLILNASKQLFDFPPFAWAEEIVISAVYLKTQSDLISKEIQKSVPLPSAQYVKICWIFSTG